jgi:hypothetical protein
MSFSKLKNLLVINLAIIYNLIRLTINLILLKFVFFIVYKKEKIKVCSKEM